MPTKTTATTAAAAAAAATRPNFIRLGKFAINKLIQNLGSNTEQYSFKDNVRSVHGRD